MVINMETLWHNIQDSSTLFFIFKALVAIIVGFLIGIERQWSRKPAGIRTNILVVLGATMFTIVSFEMAKAHNGDPTRIASNIVTGIGFLGAGAILHGAGTIKGLTSAATLWIDGALGMMVGSGRFIETGVTTILIVGVLYGLGKFEQKANLLAVEDAGEGDSIMKDGGMGFGKK